jgi:glycosyltransferase involved in cell wall biosynthesis
MKEILIISNYYPPEKGAAANRIEQLALKLDENKYKVTVICPLGNYPKGTLFPEYKGKFYVIENKNNITIKRLWIYPSVSKNLCVRVISVLSFSTCLFFYLIFKNTPKNIIVQSPPVFVLSIKNKKIILNISDLWPLAAIELKALKNGGISHRFSLFLEKFIYTKASVVLAQSNEIISHVLSIVLEKNCYLYRNFPKHDLKSLELETIEKEPIKIFYAGLLGIAQGVFELCQKIDLRNQNLELHLFGDGAEKTQIEDLILAHSEAKIYFHGMLERDELHSIIKSFDIAIVPLKTRIFGSVPSKIFEYASLGFPILYFGGGEGEKIVEENNLGWVVPVENYDLLNKRLETISLIKKPELDQMKRTIFKQSHKVFNLDNQIKLLLEKDVF